MTAFATCPHCGSHDYTVEMVGYFPFHDRDGLIHEHNPNKHTCQDCGRKWLEHCPTCGADWSLAHIEGSLKERIARLRREKT